MKKWFTLWAMLALVALSSQAFLTLPRPTTGALEFTPTVKPEVGQRYKLGLPAPMNAKAADVNDNDALIYAYRLYAASGYMHGWYNFTANSPYNLECIKEYPNEAGQYGIASATYANGKTYAYIYQMWGAAESGYNEYHFPFGIGILDEKTGEFEVKFSTAEGAFHAMQYGQLFYEMAYDPATDTIYACEFAYASDGSFQGKMNIYSINKDTCEPTLVGQLNCVIIAMAAQNGELYGLTQDFNSEDGSLEGTRLIKFNPSNAVEGVITSEDVCSIMVGKTVNYTTQSIEFDHSTHDLWWLGCRNDASFIAKINTKKGSIENEEAIPYTAQYLGLVIPYQTAASAAPTQVSEYELSRPDSAAGEVTLSWKNPSKTYDLETLTELSGVKIYRDGELIHTEATTAVGAAVTWVDNTVANGYHTYKVVPYNTAGDGIAREREIYAGEDVPDMVNNIQAQVDGDKLTLTWEAPVRGKNGCWYDAANVKYNVYRGTYSIAKGISETTISDQVTEFNAYTYTIVPFTGAGNGVSAEFNVTYGPAIELPYENDCADPDLAEQIAVIDANQDANTWTYSDGWQGFEYVAGGMYGVEIDADDYLVFPTFNAKAGKKYELQFEYYTSNYYNTFEDIEIVAGDAAVASQLSTVVTTMKIEAGENGLKWLPTRAQYLSERDGLTCLAIHIVSKYDQGFLIVKNILIREMEDAEVSAAAIIGPSEIYTNVESKYAVRVVNEGTTTVSGAVAMLVDDFGAEIAKANVPDLAVGETADVEVAWTPTSEMDIQVFGHVKLEGESYTDDNTTSDYIQVKVNKEGSDKWITIGEIDVEVYDNRPIDLTRKYSKCQTIYFEDEIKSQFEDLDKYLADTQKDYIEITGMRLFYGASQDAELLTEIPLVVRMENTETPGLIDTWYPDVMNDPSHESYDPTADGMYDYIFHTEGMTTVFDDVVDLSGTGETNIIEIKFDEPFQYKPGMNLLVDLDKQSDEKYAYVKWYLDYNEDHLLVDSGWVYKDSYGSQPVPMGRSGFYNYNYPYNPDDDSSGNRWHTAWEYFPCVKFSYPPAPDSVDAVEDASNLVVVATEGALNFNKICDTIEVFNLAGAKVLSYRNTSSVDANLPAGIYIVKAAVGDTSVAKKVMIK